MNFLEPITFATDLAMSVEELRLPHLRVDTDFDDEYIGKLIKRATRYCEGLCYKYLQPTICRLNCDFWLERLYFQSAPLISVEAYNYTDYNNIDQVWDESNYQVVKGSSRPYVWSYVSPAIQWKKQIPITIDCTVGYEVLPEQAAEAISMIVGHWYDNARNGVLIGSISKELEHSVTDLMGQLKFLEM